ncbi:tripartite tricarboxylate transporter substrate binding protein [Ramlibacter sp.]|uniref:tripartite tricarboxylate transporter substrate binding protein n=1 Tax=Ramlibacter sp. TaxID=1917967 RepID=UPI003D0CAD11
MKRKTFLGWLGAGIAAAALPAQAQAPFQFDKTIRYVVPYAPGGPTDAAARIVAEELGKRVGQPVVIFNRPGGATLTGANEVKASPADGYTLFMGSSTTFALAPLQFKNVTVTLEDFEAIGAIAKVPYVFVVSSKVPATNMKEFVAWVKSRPDGFNFGTVGQGSSTHLAGLILSKSLGIKGTPVHYKGAGPAMADLLAGHTDAQVDPLTTSIQGHRTGKIRIIAGIGAKRAVEFPEIPTLQEQGVRGLEEIPAVFGLSVKAGTPGAAVNALRQHLNAIVSDPAVAARLKTVGLEAAPIIGEDYNKLLRFHAEWYRKEVTENKIQFAE